MLALAHALKRPIIVIAETMLKDADGVALAPIPFGGVYLPLEVPLSRCHRTPLLLAYHSAHFSPLVIVDGSSDFNDRCSEGVSIPLVDPDTGQLLSVLFAVDPGPNWDWHEGSRDLTCRQDTVISSTIYWKRNYTFGLRICTYTKFIFSWKSYYEST